MKNIIKSFLVTLFLVGTCTGCSTWRKLDGTEKGAVIGGGTGAVVGDMVAPGVGGTVLGAGVGAVGGALIGDHEDDHHHRNRY